MPVGGMFGSDLLEYNPDFFKVMRSPFTGEEVVCVRSLQPDWAIIHVQEADEYGNARILGSTFQDVLLTRAAKRTIITTEKIVNTDVMREEPHLTVIPHFLVAAVVLAPGGARPGICFPGSFDPELNKVDDAGMKAYLKAVKEDTIDEYLAQVTEGRE